MSVKFYTEQENGTLKFQEEVEGTDDISAAAEALFEERPRLATANDEFVVIVTDNGALDEGIVSVLRKQEVTQTAWVGSGAEADEEDEDDEEEPAPKKRSTTRKAPAKKAAAKKSTTRKPASKAAPKGKAKAAPKRKAPAKKGRGRTKSPFTKSDNDE